MIACKMNKNSEIKDAASVILIRNRKSNPSVLMGQRSKNASFMPNKFVFPGGAVDENDFLVKSFKQLNGNCTARMTYKCNKDLVFALSVAAIRELFEETGIIVGHKKEWTGVIPPEWKPFANLGLVPMHLTSNLYSEQLLHLDAHDALTLDFYILMQIPFPKK